MNVANAEVSKLRHRNEAYQERLRKCADYEAVQDELKSLKMDVEHLKSQLTSQKTKANSEKAGDYLSHCDICTYVTDVNQFIFL